MLIILEILKLRNIIFTSYLLKLFLATKKINFNFFIWNIFILYILTDEIRSFQRYKRWERFRRSSEPDAWKLVLGKRTASRPIETLQSTLFKFTFEMFYVCKKSRNIFVKMFLFFYGPLLVNITSSFFWSFFGKLLKLKRAKF